ncbi:iron-siderophore ABC transporter substrate-binding protein [Paenibacillus sp. 1P07SE]|uniref:iron-siderophore ABC transporter substrate-binding protein n=1 Tax=Paenibacillus sp. 1P07SE TaxID=3132209 RepID=UPI0039A773AF
MNMNRTWMRLLAVTVTSVCVLLAGCGSNHTSTNKKDAEGNRVAGDNGLRTVQDEKGEQGVPNKPQRIAVTYFALTEHLLALESPPVAANYFDEMVSKLVALKPYYAGTEIIDIGSYNEINLEQLVELAPDLILAGGAEGDPSGNELIYDRLTRIAPVFYVDTAKTNDDWQFGLREVGKAIGKEQEADELIVAFEEKAEQARLQVEQYSDQSVLFIDVQEKDFYVWGADRMAPYYDGLGLKLPDGFDGAAAAMSLEGLSAIDPDHLFVHNRADEQLEPLLETLKESAVWNQLQAVEAGQLHVIDSSAFSPGPIGTVYGIDAILEALE